MKHMTGTGKKLLGVILALVMALSLLPMAVWAEMATPTDLEAPVTEQTEESAPADENAPAADDAAPAEEEPASAGMEPLEEPENVAPAPEGTLMGTTINENDINTLISDLQQLAEQKGNENEWQAYSDLYTQWDELQAAYSGANYEITDDVVTAYNTALAVYKQYSSAAATKYVATFSGGNVGMNTIVTSSLTISCDSEGNGRLDELLKFIINGAPTGSGKCVAEAPTVTGGNGAVTAGLDTNNNQFITINERFEGTVTVSGKYNNGTQDVDYSFTITCSDYVPVESVSLSPSTAQTIAADGVVAFTASVTPGSATRDMVLCSVGGTNSGAVKLYRDSACSFAIQEGMPIPAGMPFYAKGVSAGTATVTITSMDNETATASCDVTVTAAAVTEYPLWVGGTQVTSANAEDVFKDGKVKYTPAVEDDPATTDVDETAPATLTLNNYVSSACPDLDDWRYGICYKGTSVFTIVLEGTNAINALEEPTSTNKTIGIFSNKSIVVKGTGSLDVTARDQGIAINGELTVKSGTLTVTSNMSWGVGAPITIGEDVTSVVVTGGIQSYTSKEVDAISGTVKNAVLGKGWTNKAGTQGEADIAVSTSGQNLSGYKKVQFPAAKEPVSYLDATGATQSCTSYTVVENAGSSDFVMWNAGWYVVNSDVTIDSTIYLNGEVHLILVDGKTLTASKGISWNIDNVSLTIYAQSEGTSAGKLTVSGGCGINVGNTGSVTVNGGTVTTTGDIISGVSGNVTVNGGELSSTGSGYGASGVNGDVTVNGGTVTVSGSEEGDAGSSGPGVSGNVTVNGGIATFKGKSKAIEGTVKNAIPGTGWTDMAGTEGQAAIAVSTTGQNLSSYKKVQFPAAHTHDFTYTASGATLTAECKAKDCPLAADSSGKHTVALTIVAPAHSVYGDGKSAAATLDGLEAFNAATGLSVAATDIQYVNLNETLDAAPTDAGENYVAQLTVVVPQPVNSGLMYSGTSHTISVSYTIDQADPVYTTPTNLTATYGQTLADVELPSGTLKGYSYTSGTWAWDAPSTSVGNVGEHTFPATFTPKDDNYKTVKVNLTVTVNKADPIYTTPTNLVATYGQTLKDVDLNGDVPAANGQGTLMVSDTKGSWAWEDDSISVGDVGEHTFTAIFTPEDTDNYNKASADVTVTVAPKAIDGGTVKLDSSALAYTEKEQSVKVTEVYDADGKEVPADSYEVSGELTGTKCGTYTVKVTGTGNYAGEASNSWKIYNPETSNSEQDDETGRIITGEVNASPDAPETSADVDAEFAKSMLDGSETAGADVDVYLQVGKKDETQVTATDLAAVNNQLGANSTVGGLFNMELFKKVGDNAAEAQANSPTAVNVTMTVPAEEQKAEQPGYTRTFSVLQVVNGVATKMNASYNAATGQITFPVSQFTTDAAEVTYVLVYTDTAKSSSSGGKFLGEPGTTTITVDGQALSAQDYTIEGGKVTLTQAYLKTLSSGTHTLKVDDQTTVNTYKFTITSATTADKGTGIYVALLGLSAMLGAAMVVDRKRRERA